MNRSLLLALVTVLVAGCTTDRHATAPLAVDSQIDPTVQVYVPVIWVWDEAQQAVVRSGGDPTRYPQLWIWSPQQKNLVGCFFGPIITDCQGMPGSGCGFIPQFYNNYLGNGSPLAASYVGCPSFYQPGSATGTYTIVDDSTATANAYVTLNWGVHAITVSPGYAPEVESIGERTLFKLPDPNEFIRKGTLKMPDRLQASLTQ